MIDSFWHRPKRAILNIILFLGLILFIFSCVAIFTVVIWKENPKVINYIDKKIPDIYGERISNMHKRVVDSKGVDDKLQANMNLYSELENVSTLNKYYSHRQNSVSELIDYYAKNNSLEKSVNLANKWMMDYPNDFTAKFKYASTLALMNKESAKNFYEALYLEHNKVPNVVFNFEKFLSSHGYTKRANEIGAILESTEFNKGRGVSLSLFYIDNQHEVFNKYQQITRKADKIYKSSYVFSFNMKFKRLKGLRFDLNRLDVDTVLFNPKVKIIFGDKVLNDIKIKPVHDIDNLGDNGYMITGKDPYFHIKLPKSVNNYSGDMSVEVTIDVGRSSSLDANILKSPEWKFFYKNKNAFNESHSFHVALIKNNNSYKYKNENLNEMVSSVRLDLPSKTGFKVYQLEMIINNGIKVDKNNISRKHMVQKNDGLYIVIGKDPYIVFMLDKPVLMNKLNIELML